MENNKDKITKFCINNCGFYSNPLFNNMCSRCYKKSRKEGTPEWGQGTKRNLETENENKKSELVEDKNEKEFSGGKQLSKPQQIVKNKCYLCRSKLSPLKQVTNKCKCNYIFCDNHRLPENHDCSVDFKKTEREIIKERNPKLYNKPRGGRHFNRIE
ncbi:hypothetical protein K502DRAFT_287725 [Neoconidiobolus thromboides FSU 785]|nr:hypothetical protein K502DRAFT_287725 [Neoconidiobolus thromboides FSU 785]